MTQQEEYKKEFRELARITDGVNVFEMENDNIERVVNTIIKIVNEGLIG